MPPANGDNSLLIALAKYGVGAMVTAYVVWRGADFVFGSLNGKLDRLVEATTHSNAIHEEMLQAIRDLGPRYTYRPEPRP